MINKQKHNKLELEKNSLLLQYQKVRTEEQERTMNQISREIHDNMGQQLNLVCRNILVALDHAKESTQIELLQSCLPVVNDLISEAQSISHSLNSKFIMKRGLYDALYQLVEYSNWSKTQIVLDTEGDSYLLSEENQLYVFRIAQEAIQNAIKHAGATLIQVFLDFQPHAFKMTIHDNGKGFNNAKYTSGIGLENMYERAKILNGDLQVTSDLITGTTVTLNIDLLKH